MLYSQEKKVPIDGVIIDGVSTLNTSALTGESLPRDAKAGDEVISGCINMTGVLKIRTIREFGESTVSKILELVENSSSRKSKSENFISKFGKYYTPVVCYGALALAFIPPIVLLIMGKPAMWGDWIYRALTFLVISCPCALVISIPLSFFAGIGGASNQGVLVKGSNYLETLAQTSYVVFDKTGTMTQGVFEVSGVHHNEISDEKLLEYAALAECSSSHPISKSLQKAYGKPIDRNRVTNIEEISGNGVTAKVDGISVAAGNAKLMKRLGISYQECHHVGTVIHMAVDGRYEGHILISDILKPHAKEAIAELKKAGIKKTVMLTGDSKRVADQVAKELGIEEVYSELLPADKVSKVEELLHQKSEKEKLAFVGDGINDAPVLSRADIGIAMGALGSDAAIEAADIVLMDDDPLKISKAIKIARKCIHIVYENIYFAIGIKILCLILGALGIASQATEYGSMLYAKKPGDGSAREQAASCQRVIGGLANIVHEYATKRYRSNVMNWGMVPFQMEAEPNFEVGDYVFVPGIRAALDGDLKDIAAYVVRADGTFEQIELYIADMTAEERAIVKAGCLINYNKFKAAAE